MQSIRKSLDLGCGRQPKNFFEADEVWGIDIRDDIEINVVKADLVLEKIPFPNCSFDFVTAHDFLEHLPRVLYNPFRSTPFISVMNEVWRVLKPGGKFLSQTPAFPKEEAFTDPTHVNLITEKTFPLYFDNNYRWAEAYGFYGHFIVDSQQWVGSHLVTILIKTSPVENEV